MTRKGGAKKQAGGMRTRGEAKLGEESFHHIVPMARGAAEAVQGFMEAPVGPGRSDGAPRRWADNNDLIVREGGITKGVFTVTLFGDAAVLNGKGEEKADG